MKAKRIFLLGLIAVALVYQSDRSSACGPFLTRPVFSLTRGPDPPFDKFAKGNLGVLGPGFSRTYLVIAYRYLQGGNLDAREQQSVLAAWEKESPSGSAPGQEPGPDWMQARRQAPGFASLPGPVARERRLPGENSYGWYLNCNEDAFQNAAATLYDRLEKFGRESNEVKLWVEAQDQVFSNCPGGQVIPASLPPDVNPLIRADRAYQVAAAYFYVGEFDEAERHFTAIAADDASPWRVLAPYLAARALVRKGTVAAPPGQLDKPALAKAELQIKKVLADKRLVAIHPAALRLMDFVRIRLYPDLRFQELAQAVLQKGSASTLRQDLCDYARLTGRFRGEHPDDLTDWVLTFRASNPQALGHALEKWKASSSIPWLVAALSKVGASDPHAPALMAAAERVPTSSVAYPTIAYHRIRLLADSGESDAARDFLDKLLAKQSMTLSLSSRNLFLSLRLRVGRNMEEFLKFAIRETAGIYDEGLSEFEVPARESSRWRFGVQETGKLRLDPSASRFLNDRLPLRLLAGVAKQNAFPPPVQRDLAQAAWVRAILLDDHARGVELQPTLAKLIPDLKQSLDAYSAARTDESKRFAAVVLLLNFPGLRPFVTSGFERQTPVAQLDDLRENWWCPFHPLRTFDIPNFFQRGSGDSLNGWLLSQFPEDRAALPEVLPLAEKRETLQERKKLVALGAAPNYLAKQVLTWARIHPEDPRIPEALHRVVRATRVGCTDNETSRYSKAAFQFLHSHYPDSEWAKKTKYWY